MEFSPVRISLLPKGWLSILFFIFLFNLVGNKVNAQRYSISPIDVDTMIDFAPPEHYSHFIFYIQNLTDGELVFHWQQLQADIPSGWIVGMCDYGHCYGQLGLSGTMDTLPNTNTGIFALGVDPQNITGEAKVRYALWEAATPTEIDTITWIISSNNATGILEENNFRSIKDSEIIYVMDKANLLPLPFSLKEAFVVYQANGQVIYQGQKNDSGLLSSLQYWNSGHYIIRVLDGNITPKIYRFQLK
jgi:hypothetical protein